ncbi:TRAP transporter substrate-binding protein [Celeribacter indicus]|nr:TRAP transporter substrate-binding protein [Celeribacter indicus]
MANAPVAAQDSQVTLRLAHWVPPGNTNDIGLHIWADAVTEASGGSIQFQFFPGQQLGKAADHYNMARDGISDLSWIAVSYSPGAFPIAGVTELPFFVGDAVAGSVEISDWYEEYAPTEMPDVKFCMMYVSTPGSIHSTVPIRVPDDLKGKRVRPVNERLSRLVSTLGGQVFQVTVPEMRDGLERGLFDTTFFRWKSIVDFHLTELLTYHLDMPMYVSHFALVMNRSAYERLSDDQKAVIDDHCNGAWAGKMAANWAGEEAEDGGRDAYYGQESQTVYAPSKDEIRQWKDAAAPLTEQWISEVAASGHTRKDPQVVLEELRNRLGSAGALVED